MCEAVVAGLEEGGKGNEMVVDGAASQILKRDERPGYIYYSAGY